MKSPISRMTVGRLGSSINSGSRARKDRHFCAICGSSENAPVNEGGRSRGTGVVRLSNVARIAAARTAPSKVKKPRHRKKVVEVFHPAVLEVERHHGLELLGSHRFTRIGVELGRWLIEKSRIFGLRWIRCHDLAKTDIDLDWEHGSPEARRCAQADASIVLIVANWLRGNVLSIEAQSISLSRLNANVAEMSRQGARLRDRQRREGLGGC